MAEAGRDWTLRVLRGSNQQPGALGVPATRDRPLAAHAPTTQPAGRHPPGIASRSSPTTGSLNRTSFTRGRANALPLPPEVGAGCLNRARPDLGGGHSEMGVPTANSRFSAF